jgi:hypothetical protein
MLHTLKQRHLLYEFLSPYIRNIKLSRWNSIGHLSNAFNVNEKCPNKITIFLKRGFIVLHYKIF